MTNLPAQTTSTAISIREDQQQFDERQVAALKQLGLNNAQPADLAVFFHQAKRTGLDPFTKQIYGIVRGGKFGIQAGIDGLRVVAQRTNLYAGQLGPFWCGEDGVWKDVWLEKTPPRAAKIAVLRKDFAEPLWAVARWESYAQMSSPTWKNMPDVMLAKCAESLALRKAFPQDLSGIYTAEEMDQAAPKPESVAPAGHVRVIDVQTKAAPVVVEVIDEVEVAQAPIDPSVEDEVEYIEDETQLSDPSAPADTEPATPHQIKTIAIIRKELNIDDAAYRHNLGSIYGVPSSTQLTQDQAADLIGKLRAAQKKARSGSPLGAAIREASK